MSADDALPTATSDNSDIYVPTDSDKEKLSALCTSMEDWLYDEGLDVEKAVYDGKLKELTGEFAAGEEREKEAGLRPDAVTYTSALDSCNATADWRGALELLAESAYPVPEGE